MRGSILLCPQAAGSTAFERMVALATEWPPEALMPTLKLAMLFGLIPPASPAFLRKLPTAATRSPTRNELPPPYTPATRQVLHKRRDL